MQVEIYKSEYKAEWDAFVRQSKNGTFLFCRDFMEYHSNRFCDLSFLFYDDKARLIALLPGNRVGDMYYSHQGLTYGGLIMNESTTAVQVLDMFDILKARLYELGFKEMVYKAIPHIYHQKPSEEDLYALFRNKAQLLERNISSTICLSERLEYSRLRRRGVKKAEKNNLRIVNSSAEITDFWGIVTSNMQSKYHVSPVHNVEEISFLMDKFPDNIQLLTVYSAGGEILGGCLNFITDTLVHAQYAAASEEGKECGALDFLIDYILTAYPEKRYFDFGISNENRGQYLNENLIFQKEGFGARGVVYDIYSMKIESL